MPTAVLPGSPLFARRELPEGPPDATLHWPEQLLVQIPQAWQDVLGLGLTWQDTWPFAFIRTTVEFSPRQAAAISFWYGPSRAACTAALRPAMRLLMAWRRGEMIPVVLAEMEQESAQWR